MRLKQVELQLGDVTFTLWQLPGGLLMLRVHGGILAGICTTGLAPLELAHKVLTHTVGDDPVSDYELESLEEIIDLLLVE